MSLNLTPNEIVGYRIKPDWYSYTVVLVKRHGPASKNHGAEYETTLAHCKNLPFAVNWIFGHSTRVRAEASQAEIEAIDGSVASLTALGGAFEAARADALKAVADLEQRLDKAGLARREQVALLAQDRKS